MSDCTECQTDELLRHDPLCQRARELGLPQRDSVQDDEFVGGYATEEEAVELEEDDAVTAEREAEGVAKLTLRDPTRCVACLERHIDGDRDQCLKIGRSLVHPDCAWRVHYGGLEAGQIIAILEGMVVLPEGGDNKPDSVRRFVQDVANG